MRVPWQWVPRPAEYQWAPVSYLRHHQPLHPYFPSPAPHGVRRKESTSPARAQGTLSTRSLIINNYKRHLLVCIYSQLCSSNAICTSPNHSNSMSAAELQNCIKLHQIWVGSIDYIKKILHPTSKSPHNYKILLLKYGSIPECGFAEGQPACGGGAALGPACDAPVCLPPSASLAHWALSPWDPS